MSRETPKQYSARRVRTAIERAKAAIMEIQEELADFRGDPADYQQLTDSALAKLDTAWRMASQREQHYAWELLDE